MVDNFRNRTKLLYASIFLGLVGILTKVIYRPWVIDNNINDLGINGFAPNFFIQLEFAYLLHSSLKKDILNQ